MKVKDMAWFTQCGRNRLPRAGRFPGRTPSDSRSMPQPPYRPCGNGTAGRGTRGVKCVILIAPPDASGG